MLSDDKIKEIAVLLSDEGSAGSQLRRFIYKGMSMTPLLRPDDCMSVRLSGADELRLGDIIVYERAGELIIHRFIKYRTGQGRLMLMCAKADNRPSMDESFSREYFLGKVIKIKRGIKQINLEDKLWRAISFLIGAASLLEAVVFRYACSALNRIFKRAKIKKYFRGAVSKFIIAPKFVVLKTLNFIL